MKDTHVTRKIVHLTVKTELGWTTTACGLRGWAVQTFEDGFMNRWRVFRSSSNEKACTCRLCLGLPIRRGKRRKGIKPRKPRSDKGQPRATAQDGMKIVG